jgi:hypothetical protein
MVAKRSLKLSSQFLEVATLSRDDTSGKTLFGLHRYKIAHRMPKVERIARYSLRSYFHVVVAAEPRGAFRRG